MPPPGPWVVTSPTRNEEKAKAADERCQAIRPAGSAEKTPALAAGFGPGRSGVALHFSQARCVPSLRPAPAGHFNLQSRRRPDHLSKLRALPSAGTIGAVRLVELCRGEEADQTDPGSDRKTVHAAVAA